MLLGEERTIFEDRADAGYRVAKALAAPNAEVFLGDLTVLRRFLIYETFS